MNLNVHLAVLRAETSCQAIHRPAAERTQHHEDGFDTRQPERCALHLSNPNTRNVAALNAANQMAANESWIFKRGLVLAFYFQIGV